MNMNRRDFSRLMAAVLATDSFDTLLADDIEIGSLPAYAGPWMPLFNGTDLSGWSFFQDGVGETDKTNAVVVEQGQIRMLGPRHTGGARPGFGHIATVREYANYHLRLEFKFGDARFEPRLLSKRNSGVLYHMFPERDRVWPNSIEFQLEESDVGDAILINARCYPRGGSRRDAGVAQPGTGGSQANFSETGGSTTANRASACPQERRL
jgi:hypothetical protein